MQKIHPRPEPFFFFFFFSVALGPSIRLALAAEDWYRPPEVGIPTWLTGESPWLGCSFFFFFFLKKNFIKQNIFYLFFLIFLKNIFFFSRIYSYFLYNIN